MIGGEPYSLGRHMPKTGGKFSLDNAKANSRLRPDQKEFNSAFRSFFIPDNLVGDPNSVAEVDSTFSNSSNPGGEKKDSWDGSSWSL